MMGNEESTRRVKDILTPLGAIPHPPRSLALVAPTLANFPKQAQCDTTHPQIPHVRSVPLKNGKIVPGLSNSSGVLMKLIWPNCCAQLVCRRVQTAPDAL
jgi:hypothetical protein